MGYMHIDNLYKNQDILQFKECYALEKIHGTSANVTMDEKGIKFNSGGEKHDKFIKLFDAESLFKKYKELFIEKVILFGEAYGGKCQRMSATYGDELKFVVFEVKVGDNWLDVPNAEDVTNKFGLEFVDYHKVLTDLNSLNAERDLPSVQAVRNGCGNDKIREGIVLRPLIEVTKNNGNRIICKHKRDEFRETKTPRKVSAEELKVIADAKRVAIEWVTLERLRHVLDKLKNPNEIEDTGKVIKAMIEDVYREGDKEIVVSSQVTKEICRTTALLYKKLITKL